MFLHSSKKQSVNCKVKMDISKCDFIRSLLCNICGLYTPRHKQRNFTKLVIDKYKQYFKRDPQINEIFSPNNLCVCCHSMLLKTEHRSIFAVPMIWSAPDVAHMHCYSCLMPSLVGKKWCQRNEIQYPKRSSCTLPEKVLSSDEIDAEEAGTSCPDNHEDDLPLTDSTPTIATSSSYHPQPSTSAGHADNPDLVGQASFDDLTRDLNLSSNLSELLGSRLREKKLLKTGTRTANRSKFDDFRSTFDEHNGITYLRNLHGLFELFETEHDPTEWRLFIDGSVSSLKAMLLHNGNVYPSIPVAYSNIHKEEYNVLQDILYLINYPDYKWKIIADFKLINILMGLKKGNPKFPCFVCLWDRNNDGDKYSESAWPTRPSFDKYPDNKPDLYSAILEPLVAPEDILHPPLHIKLGLVTQLFKKLVQQNSKVKEHLKDLFPKLTDMKVEMGIFDGPKIRDIFKSTDFDNILTIDEKSAYQNLKLVCAGFLGNHRANNYKELISNMMASYKKLDINVTLKMHSLICHLERFPSNLGSFSDEQGERAHQDLKDIEQRFKGKNNVNAMGTYCWGLVRQKDPEEHKKQSPTKTKYFVVQYM